MHFNKKSNLLYIAFFAVSVYMLTSCQLLPTPKTTLAQHNLTLDEAVQQLIHQLVEQVQADQNIFDRWVMPKIMVFNPFVDQRSNQVLQLSPLIENRFMREVQEHFRTFEVKPMNWHNLREADYLINGIIQLQAHEGLPQTQKYYLVKTAVVDLKTKLIVAKHSVAFIDKGENYDPTPSYADNPVYIREHHASHLNTVIEAEIGSRIDDNFYQLMETRSLLAEAQAAYDQANYDLAASLFETLRQRPEGELMETYGGLYITYFKLGQLDKAETYFAKMIQIGIKQESLPIKLLFESQLAEFLNNEELRKQYEIWIRQISRYFSEKPDVCVDIIGHSSRYGEDEFNLKLSERRAEKIQNDIARLFPGITKRSRIVGKGSIETIVGTVPDSAENAVDRRVEFKIIDCSRVH